jgi:hypothetical protein
MRQPLSLRLVIRAAILFIISLLVLAIMGRLTRLYAQSVGILILIGVIVSGLLSVAGIIAGSIELFDGRQRPKSLLALAIGICLIALVIWQLFGLLNFQ